MFKIIYLIMIIPYFLFSHDFNDNQFRGCGKYTTYKSLKNLELMEAIHFPRRNYDILEIKLDADWRNPLSSEGLSLESRTWSAVEQITLKIDSANTNSIELDLRNIRVDSLSIIDFDEAYTYDVGQNLKINFEDTLLVNSEMKIEIAYTYIGTDYVGFILVEKGTAPERLAYTMSQPNDAKNWVICNDNPYEKQMFKLNLRLPRGFVGASNGLLKGLVENQNDVIYSWEHEYPIPSYLMVINASKYYRFDLKTPRIENPSDSILFDNYVWQIDYTKGDDDNSPYYADKTLSKLPAMADFLQGLFGPYPFEKFGTVTVENFWAAGMEHQSIQTIRRDLLIGDEDVLIHELAHMWLGDKVTPTSWRDIWMSEGGAQWAEALWKGYTKGGDKQYQDYMVAIKKYYLTNSGALRQDPIYLYDIESTVFGNNRFYIIYQKASWIYHQLSNFIGKDEFFTILKDYLKQNAYTSIDGEQFIKFFEDRATNPAMPIRKFFDQFVYSAGQPLISFNYNVTQNESDFDAYINLSQIQDRIQNKNPKFLDLYEFPFVIDFIKNNELVYRDTITMNEKIFEKNYSLDFEPDSIIINESFTFFDLIDVTTSVNTDKVSNNFEVNPNPIINGENFNLKTNINKNGQYQISLIDINGRVIEEIYSGYLKKGSFELNTNLKTNLSTGMYFIQILGEETKFAKILVK